MYRIFKLAMLLMVMSVALFTAVHAEQFVDPSATFAVQIPSGWVSQDTQDVLSLAAPNKISQINISKQDSEGLTLAQFSKAFISEMKKSLKSFKLVSAGKTTVSGTPAGVWVYTAKVEGVTLKFKNYVVFPKSVSEMYNVVFATLPANYKKDVTGLDSMIKSWSWSSE